MDQPLKVSLDTLIVWTEVNGTDMALSFQEAEGCTTIWSVNIPSMWPNIRVYESLAGTDVLPRIGNSSVIYNSS